MEIRYVIVKAEKYLRKEDVIALLLEFAATEETSIQDRMSLLITNLRGEK